MRINPGCNSKKIAYEPHRKTRIYVLLFGDDSRYTRMKQKMFIFEECEKQLKGQWLHRTYVTFSMFANVSVSFPHRSHHRTPLNLI